MELPNSQRSQGTHSTLSSIPDPLKYVVIALLILYASTRVFHAGAGHIFALILTYLVVTNLEKTSSETFADFNRELDYKNESLGVPSHFHYDANLINLFYDLLDWRRMNANNFDVCLNAVNNILIIEKDSEKGIERCVDNYEVARDQMLEAMNLMHGFVYSLDHPLYVKKLKNVLPTLQQLLMRHVTAIQENCVKNTNGININTRFIEDANGPKPFDAGKMTPFDFY